MTIKNSHGLSVNFLENGSQKSIEANLTSIGLRATTPFSKTFANLYLRKRTNPLEYKALLGTESDSIFKTGNDVFVAQGSWAGMDYKCTLQLSDKSLSWQWSIEITNTSDETVELDVIHVQDVGLKPTKDGVLNEYYVSQYLERLVLEDKTYGSVICCRQNVADEGKNPWLMMACKNSARTASVDGMQIYGKTFRETGVPEGLISDELGGEYSGESSILAIQETPFELAPKNSHTSVFVATYLPDHPKATSESDLKLLPNLMAEFEGNALSQIKSDPIRPEKNIFHTSDFLPVNDLNTAELDLFFDKERRHTEEEKGQLLSFFCKQNNHVVLRAKETIVDRPHGHILQARAGYKANENIVSTTSYAYGVFNSHLTQGNTNFNIFLSISSSQFNLVNETGQRIFVKVDGKQYLLGVPSAFEIGLNHCRWIYKFGDHCFQVRTWTSKKAPQVNLDFKVISGKNVSLLVTHDFDDNNGWNITPGEKNNEFISKPAADSLIAEKFPQAQFKIVVHSDNTGYITGGDELLTENKKNQGSSLFVIKVQDTSDFCMSFTGEVISQTATAKIEDADKQWILDCEDGQSVWQDMCLNLSLKGENKDTQAIQEILPWYCNNALTHFLTPHGLEQTGGAAWGTRDVNQGPLELLLCMQKYDDAKEVIRSIFSHQNTDGGWPQWWMFDSYATIRDEGSHGDVFYWCLISLSSYIKVTGDSDILNEVLPYYHEDGVDAAEKTPLSEHVERLINMVIDSFIEGTALVPFGGGDWNDSMQPASKDLANRLISSWTVALNYQAFTSYQAIYEKYGDAKKARDLKAICEQIKADFYKYLIKDDTVAGHGMVEDGGNISLLLHPSDGKTNIQYRLLPMIRGIISGIFTKEQAQHHLKLIEKHLKGPDGARLMNRPPKYHGGIQTIFQRAESSTFFGREIGIMYVHAHLRYTESQARTGNADAFLKGLRQSIPVGYREIVPCADIRQSNCYYSSSDVAFKNRYEADERYEDIKAGKIKLRGGWRIYSSGPGIYLGLVVSQFLGLRIEFGNTIIDPVIPHSLDGLSVSLEFMGRSVNINYKVKDDNFSPKTIAINGKSVQFTYQDNQYRQGGAMIPTEQLLASLNQQENTVDIQL